MAFDLQPTLRSALVELRPLRASDHDVLYAVASDPLIWEQHPDKTRSEPAGSGPSLSRHWLRAGRSWPAMPSPTASSGPHDSTAMPRQDEVEIGWTFLARSHWGDGTTGR